MWYLIVPPIIVVMSLSFVLWYFSRKSADPLIVAKAVRLGTEAERQVSFLRTKAWLLRILEKTASRFKVLSLRIHNALHDFTQTIKARQRRFQDRAAVATGMPGVSGQEEQYTARTGFFRRLTKKTQANTDMPRRKEQSEPAGHSSGYVPEQGNDTMIAGGQTAAPAAMRTPSAASEETVRPMVSETMAYPIQPRARTEADMRREEDLIARIAVNPKDFAAYEGLGDHYLDAGNTRDAKECYRQVLRLSPAHRMVKIKIRRLEKLFSEQQPM